MIQTRDGAIHLTYTYTVRPKESTIMHAVISEDWILAGN